MSEATYGEAASLQAVASISGILPRDDVRLSSAFFIPETLSLVDRLPARQSVGSYLVGVKSEALTGADASNYTLGGQRARSSEIEIKPLPIPVIAAQSSSTYGTQAVLRGSVRGVLSGDSVEPIFAVAGVEELTSRTPAGSYVVSPAGLKGADSKNYSVSKADSTSSDLLVFRRGVNVTGDTSDLNITYGETVNKQFSASDLLPFAKVKVDAMAGTSTITAPTKLDAGNYVVVPVLSGFDAPNYFISNPGISKPAFGTVQVAKRQLTLTDQTIIYGNEIKAALGNVVDGDTLEPIVSNVEIDRSVPGFRSKPATIHNGFVVPGTYIQYVKEQKSGPWQNYELPGAVTVVVDKATLFWRPFSSEKVYGSALDEKYGPSPLASNGVVAFLGGLSGFVGNDDVYLKSAMIGTTKRPVDNDGGRSQAFFNGTLNAGRYAVTVSQEDLTGRQSSYYRFVPQSSGELTVQPKTISATVTDKQVVYGNFRQITDFAGSRNNDPRQSPNAWRTDDGVLNSILLKGVIADDVVRSTVGIANGNGGFGVIDARTTPGKYQQSLIGLAGSSALNYRLDGNTASSSIEVLPLPINYSTTSALYLAGAGLVGKPGIPSIRATPINGDEVEVGVVIAKNSQGNADNLAALQEGRYTFPMLNLSGKDAAKYRITTNNSAFDRFGNDVGTLDVFADTTFGFNYVGVVDVPKVPAYTPPAPTQRVSAPNLTSMNKVGGVALPEFTRDVVVTGTDGEIKISSISFSTSGIASGVSEQNVAVGAGTLSGAASGSGDGSFKIGVSGISTTANVSGHVDATMTIGVGFIAAGAQGNAAVEAGAGVTGVKLSADATAAVAAQGGAGGSLGNAGTGTVSATASTFAFARSDTELSVKDGKVVVKAEESVGVGVSIGAKGAISGSTGSVGAGATVYSPGSVGGTFDWAGGLTDDALSVSLNLGAKIGLGGLAVNISFSIDRYKLESAFAPVIELFGGTARVRDTALESWTHAQTLRSNPAQYLAYLNSTSDWKNVKSSHVTSDALFDAKRQLMNYQDLVNGYPFLINSQKETQKRLIDLLKTDPAAAIALAHSHDFRQDYKSSEASIVNDANSLGLKFVSNGGQMTLVNK